MNVEHFSTHAKCSRLWFLQNKNTVNEISRPVPLSIWKKKKVNSAPKILQKKKKQKTA